MLSMRQNRARIALAFALTALFLLRNITGIDSITTSRFTLKSDHSASPSQFSCSHLPGTDETLIVIRTGSTELVNRLTVHLSTSLRCFPNHLIFSDLEEQFHGEHIIDALADVSLDIKENDPDFELYRRLRKDGRLSLDSSELTGSPEKFAIRTGKAENPGWKLDEWKFLPMVDKTLYERPNMKWYVFMEADSFLLGSMLQQYLATLDSTEPVYAGKQMLIGDDLFAHGGSGFVVSQPALRTVVDYYTAHKAEIEEFTAGHWAGDCVLGKAFTDSGVPFTNAWPAFQVDYPGLVQYTRADARANDKTSRLWCGTPISYHHMSAAMVEEMWNFEKNWSAVHNADTETFRHRDVFATLIMPQMMTPRTDWDNLSNQEDGTIASVDECRAQCIAQPECKHYSFDQDRICRTNIDPRLGKAAQGVTSGWMEDRVRIFQQGMAPCENGSWLFNVFQTQMGRGRERAM